MNSLSKTRAAVSVAFMTVALCMFAHPASATTEPLLHDAKITRVTGDIIKATLNGVKYKIDASNAYFYRADDKKATLAEMKRTDHIDVWGDLKKNKKVTADTINNLSIRKLSDPLRGTIKKIYGNSKKFKMTVTDIGTVTVLVQDDTTIRSTADTKKDFTYLAKKFVVDAKGIYDSATKTIYSSDSIHVVSKK